MKLNISHETRVGIFVIVTLVVLILGYNYLRGNDVFSSDDTYYAIYDNIDGLEEANPVLLQGYQIGKVSKIELHRGEKMIIRVKFTIKDNLPVPMDSKAKIINSDLLGSKAVELVIGKSDQYHKSYDTLQSDVALSMTATIDNYVSPITDKANLIMGKFEEYLQEGGKQELQTMVTHLKNTTKNLDETTGKLNEYLISEKLVVLVNKLNSVADNLQQNNDKISTIIANLESVSDTLKTADLKQTITETKEAIKSIREITDKINNNEGTAGLLVNDKQVYDNLNKNLIQLNILLEDLNKHPEKYVHFSVFGKKVQEEVK